MLERREFTGDREYTKRCHAWFEAHLGCAAALLMSSCTDALEVAALLAEVGPGDEVIMPSFTFVSTANAFALRGATIVFVDVRPDTMNLDETRIEAAITPKTRAIVPVHYGGVSCDMDAINAIAAAHGLLVIEDAAQVLMATAGGRPVGTAGALAAFSFHATKNYTCGEGGLLAVNDPRFVARAEILRDKGTNRGQFFRGQVDKYTWVDLGSSFVIDEFRAAILFAQLEAAEAINARRTRAWHRYAAGLAPLAASGAIELQRVPDSCRTNAHLFYLKAADLAERTRLIAHLSADGIQALFHFVPLHSAPAGLRFGRFAGEDVHTTKDSERLLRLPMYDELTDAEVDHVVASVTRFYAR